MKQPPAKSKVPPVGLEVIPQSLSKIVIVMVLEANCRCICRRVCQRDDARQVVSTAKKVELDPSKDGQKGKGVNKSKGPGDSYIVLALISTTTQQQHPTATYR